jgi:hypothetical protein
VDSGFQFSDEEEFTISDEYTENNFEGLPESEFIFYRKKSLIMKKIMMWKAQ